MSLQAVLAPLFVQVALTFALMFWMGGVRTTSIRRGEVKMRDIALGQPAWTEQATKLGNAFRNQFELPVLFYVLVVLAIMARKADFLFVIMSWLFVVLPACVLNYFGQGALLLGDENAVSAPFFLLTPSWARLPLVLLAYLFLKNKEVAP